MAGVEARGPVRGVALGCWCMCCRESGPAAVPAGVGIAGHRRERLRRLASRRPPPGLLAFRGRLPVGWMALAPREELLRLRRSPVMKPVDERPVWSIVCFVVPAAHRHQGVATALLAAAAAHARRHGATVLEAYPVDRDGAVPDDALWFGPKSMYDRAGFIEVARRRPQRPVVRLELGSAARTTAGAPNRTRA